MPGLGFELGGELGNDTVAAVEAAVATTALQPRDIMLDDNADWKVAGGDLNLVEGLESIRQDAQMRMQFFLGEWFLDEGAGIPYFDQVLVKNPNLAAIRTIFRNALLNTLGITDVTRLDLTYNAGARTLHLDWAAQTDLGLIDGTVQVGV